MEIFPLLSSHALAVQHNLFPVMAINIQNKYKEFIDHMVLNLYCYSKQRQEKNHCLSVGELVVSGQLEMPAALKH